VETFTLVVSSFVIVYLCSVLIEYISNKRVINRTRNQIIFIDKAIKKSNKKKPFSFGLVDLVFHDKSRWI
jgi:hypothetical protein